MKKVAVYMRVSTTNQEQEETIDNQKMELMARIEKDGVYLAPDCIYQDDGWSGGMLERPSLDKLRADAVDKKFEVLYVYDRGRIARVFIYQEIVIQELTKKGIEVISLHDINGTSSEEILMGQVMGIFHEYERVKITERMRIGKIRRVKENGKLLGYQPRYGYNYHPRIKKGPDIRDGCFTINQEQAKVVRIIFDLSAGGLSKYAIRTELHRRGIPPLKGKKTIWSTSVIDRILRDTTYVGEHYYNKTESVETKNPRKIEKYRKTLKGSRVARPKSEWLPVNVDAIVERAVFDKAQVQLARNKKFSKRNNSKHQYLVAGLIYCTCELARTGDPANNSLYYRCTDRLNNACGTRKCYERGVNASVLDDLVWKHIKQTLQHPELIYEQAKRWQNKPSPVDDQITILKQHLQKLDEKHNRFIKIYGDGDLSEHEYKNEKYEIDKQREVIISEISALENEKANVPSLPLGEIVSGVVELVEELDFESKQQIIRKLVKKIVATKKEVNVWGYLPILETGKIGLNVKYRYRWTAQCRQVNTFQRPHQQRHPSGKLSVRND